MKKKIDMPKNASIILKKLNQAGFQAYVVGGCVRDSLMGLKPHDWDICTSATPEQVAEVFDGYRVIPTGIQHGTITVVMDSELYEITTFRIDGDYSDNRHPDDVQFTSTLIEDLKRRDFTINAMAYNPETGIIDYFGGKWDIKRKRIRCVGNPSDRFGEDALRILRAARFAAVYNFKIETKTKIAMFDNAESLRNIAFERINAEFVKTFKKSKSEIMLYLLRSVVPELSEDAIAEAVIAMDSVCGNYSTKIALIFGSLGDKTERILRRLKFDNHTISDVLKIIEVGEALSSGEYPQNIVFAARTIANKCGKYTMTDHNACEYARAKASAHNDMDKKHYAFLVEMALIDDADYHCCHLEDLDINGNDLLALGFTGKQIGEMLNSLLEKVMYDKLPNIKSILIEEAQELAAFAK